MPNPTPYALLQTETGAQLVIYGDIGADDWSAPTSVTARSVIDQLAAMPDAELIEVRINSYGGYVSDGLAIYNALKQHPARIVVHIDGLAASIASVIAMAGDEVRMPVASLMMIHAPWGAAVGNSREMQQQMTSLQKHAEVMAAAYAAKTGRPVAEMLALLEDGADHWFTAEEAIAEGFADVLVTSADSDPAALPAEAASGLQRYHSRAPARIAAALRNFEAHAMPTPNSSETVAAALAADRARRAAIRDRFARFVDREPALRELQQSCEDDPQCAADIAGNRLLAKMAEGSEPLGALARGQSPCGTFTGGGAPKGSDFVEAASDALLLRAGLRLSNVHPAARDLAGMSITEMAATVLSRAGRTAPGFRSQEALRAALSTSDFPALLANSATKALRSGYEVEAQSHRAWVAPTTVADFKQQHRPILGSAPELKQVLEGGEYEFGAMDEDQAQYAVTKWGRIVKLTFEALVNDDLQAFARAQQAMGQAAARREADEVYALVAANAGAGQTMQDGKALFHVDHGNLAAAATAFDVAALSSARTLLRKQTALGGGLLNLQPRFLLVPAELESEAEMLLAASTRHLQQSGAVDANTPTWISSLQLVVEPRLADDAVFVMAAPPQVDTFELAFLERDGGPVVFEEPLTGSDDLQYRIRHVFGGRFLDWRGVVKIPISGG